MCSFDPCRYWNSAGFLFSPLDSLRVWSWVRLETAEINNLSPRLTEFRSWYRWIAEGKFILFDLCMTIQDGCVRELSSILALSNYWWDPACRRYSMPEPHSRSLGHLLHRSRGSVFCASKLDDICLSDEWAAAAGINFVRFWGVYNMQVSTIIRRHFPQPENCRAYLWHLNATELPRNEVKAINGESQCRVRVSIIVA